MERSYLNALGDALKIPQDVREGIEQDLKEQKQALPVNYLPLRRMFRLHHCCLLPPLCLSKENDMLPKASVSHAMTQHGDTVDNYYWLRDDTRSQPEVLDYLQQENAYGRRLWPRSRLQDRVLKEIIDRIPPQDACPYVKNGYRYRHIYEPGANTPFISVSRPSVKSGMNGILLDANQRGGTQRVLYAGGLAISPDNTMMALAEDYLSRRQYGVRFRNLQSGNWYPEVLENVEAGFVWANDSQTFYYVRKHATTLLPYQVWRHTSRLAIVTG
jgi:oligopeptidase B